MQWLRSGFGVLVCTVFFPPLGLVMLWWRRGRVVWKMLGSLGIAGVAVAELFLVFGLHVELDGTGMRPIFSFYRREAHFAALEKSRTEIPSPLPAVTPAAAEKLAAPETPAVKAAAVLPAYWTDFRGPKRDGIYDEMEIRTEWPARGLPRLWKQPVGGGYASFTVARGKAFTIEQRRGQEVVAAYDIETGREVWKHGWDALFQETMGGDGPRATPTWHEGKLYALGATGEFRCFNAGTGNLLWSKNILTDNGAQNLTWGMAASPLIVDDKVIVLPGGPGGKSVVAYNKLTGEPVWKVLDDKQAYVSPMLVTLGGKRQILVVSALRAMGLAPEDGRLLWEYPWETQYGINCAQPIVVSENRLFISSGYGHGAALVELTPRGVGFEARTVWQNIRMKNKFNASVLYQGHIYGLDEGILGCIDVDTGAQKWKGGRYGYGQVLLASGHLVVLTESGEVVLVKATPERLEEVAKFEAISGKTWNVPAIAGGLLLVRNETEMACFRLGR